MEKLRESFGPQSTSQAIQCHTNLHFNDEQILISFPKIVCLKSWFHLVKGMKNFLKQTILLPLVIGLVNKLRHSHCCKSKCQSALLWLLMIYFISLQTALRVKRTHINFFNMLNRTVCVFEENFKNKQDRFIYEICKMFVRDMQEMYVIFWK